MESLPKSKDGDNRRERKGRSQKMAFHYTLHCILCKNVTIHTGDATITQSEDGLTGVHLPEPYSPKYKKVGGEFHFETSDTKITLIPDVAPKDGDPSKKVGDKQTVFTLDIGSSFTLKVNGFTAKLKNDSTKRENLLTMKSDNFNQFFSYEECDDRVTVIAMAYDDMRQLKDLREGACVPLPGVDGFIYEVTEVVRDKGWRTKVTVQMHRGGAPVGQAYTVSGDDNSWFVPSVPPRTEL